MITRMGDDEVGTRITGFSIRTKETDRESSGSMSPADRQRDSRGKLIVWDAATIICHRDEVPAGVRGIGGHSESQAYQAVGVKGRND